MTKLLTSMTLNELYGERYYVSGDVAAYADMGKACPRSVSDRLFEIDQLIRKMEKAN